MVSRLHQRKNPFLAKVSSAFRALTTIETLFDVNRADQLAERDEHVHVPP